MCDLVTVSCAASLAHHGLMDGDVRVLELCDVDLTSIPGEHLASLASLTSSVTMSVFINNMSGMLPILEHVSSEWLIIDNQTLDTEETRALAEAMGSRVEAVRLDEGVTLDIGALAKYDGQGKCRELKCYLDTRTRYREQLINFATSINWKVTNDNEARGILIEKM